jgi:uncharacterized protein RhaS with RHS repeats
MGVRPYDPSLGRFLAVDPIDGGSLNNYDYAGQDPVNRYDLTGAMVAGETQTHDDANCDSQSGTCGNSIDLIPDPRATALGQSTRKLVLRIAINVGATVLIASCTAATAGVCAGTIVPALFAIAAGSGAGVADYYLTSGKKTANGVARASIQGALYDPGGAGFALSGLFKMSAPEAERTFTKILLRAFGVGK